MKFDLKTMSCESLFYHFSVHDHHEAGVELCDRANEGNKEAKHLADKIHKMAEELKEK